MVRFATFEAAILALGRSLKENGRDVPVSRWQGVDTEGTFREVTFQSFVVHQVPHSLGDLREAIKPNLPWADDHFLERVGGEALNPGEQYKNWPYWVAESEDISLRDGKFSHTYMERFWPRWAGELKDFEGRGRDYNFGVRYRYGDLEDVVDLLRKDPHTRQAYVPIWFPEDTGAVHGERVPCTIGYFFLMRNNRLHMRYHIRSCDFVRYLRDDIYMAARLQLWVLEQLEWDEVLPGEFHMDIDSLHMLGRDFGVKS
jgi:Thymidylate synthase